MREEVIEDGNGKVRLHHWADALPVLSGGGDKADLVSHSAGMRIPVRELDNIQEALNIGQYIRRLLCLDSFVLGRIGIVVVSALQGKADIVLPQQSQRPVQQFFGQRLVHQHPISHLCAGSGVGDIAVKADSTHCLRDAAEISAGREKGLMALGPGSANGSYRPGGRLSAGHTQGTVNIKEEKLSHTGLLY